MWFRFLLFLSAWLAGVASYSATRYDIGTPTLAEVWVDPVSGSDGASGQSRASALRTLTAAWSKVPADAALSATGYRINLMPGTFACEPGPEDSNCQNYFADRRGSLQYPVILRAADGPNTVTLRGGLNLRGLRYFYLLDVSLAGGASLPTNSSGNNLLHLEDSDHVLLRGVSLIGPNCDNDSCNNLQEVLKVNQVQHLYVENSTIGGAWHSSVDYFAVQYGHFIGNQVHTAGQWGMYIKGGSAYLTIEGNEFFGSQLGFQAGQSANFAMMRPPWLHYEAYDIKFINNLLHDIPGVGVSVAGGYNILLAYNTLYNVGTSTDNGYPMMSFVHGERNCTATYEMPNPVPGCNAYASQGGWGPVIIAEGRAVIPNRHVLVFNNLLYNPSGSQSLYSLFFFEADAPVESGFVNIPVPSRADDGLVLRGNLVWNGSTPTGAGEPGCAPTHSTCNEAQLQADNRINQAEPQLIDPAHGNYRPASSGNLLAWPAWPIPDFGWGDVPTSPVVPVGNLANAVTTDRDGRARQASGPVGAYASSSTGTSPLPLVRGWNLLGNGRDQSFAVATLFQDPALINSVWQWDAARARWQFYTPQLAAAALGAYAASHGYDLLGSIKPGEGYWVNSVLAVTLTAPWVQGDSPASPTLAPGWNLVASGTDLTAAALSQSVSGIQSIWAWDTATSKWFFYAPSLAQQGGSVLADYISSKGYLDFTQHGKTLGNGIGFWVNRP